MKVKRDGLFSSLTILSFFVASGAFLVAGIIADAAGDTGAVELFFLGLFGIIISVIIFAILYIPIVLCWNSESWPGRIIFLAISGGVLFAVTDIVIPLLLSLNDAPAPSISLTLLDISTLAYGAGAVCAFISSIATKVAQAAQAREAAEEKERKRLADEKAKKERELKRIEDEKRKKERKKADKERREKEKADKEAAIIAKRRTLEDNARQGDAASQYELGKIYIDEKQYALALKNLKNAAESGHEAAMGTLMRKIYGSSRTGFASKSSYRYWLEELVKRDNPRAMVIMGGILCRVDAGLPNSFGDEAYFDEPADYQKGIDMIETALKNDLRTKEDHEKLLPSGYLTIALAYFYFFYNIMSEGDGSDAMNNGDFTIAKMHLPILEKADSFFSKGIKGMKQGTYNKESIKIFEDRHTAVIDLLNHIKTEGGSLLATDAELADITHNLDEIDHILTPVERAFFQADSAFSLEKAQDSFRTVAAHDNLSRLRGDHSNKFGEKCYDYENEFLPGFHKNVENSLVRLAACGTVKGQLPQNYANRIRDAFIRISNCDSHIVDLYNLVAKLQKEHDGSIISDSQIAENKRFYEANKGSIKEMSDMFRKYM